MKIHLIFIFMKKNQYLINLFEKMSVFNINPANQLIQSKFQEDFISSKDVILKFKLI